MKDHSVLAYIPLVALCAVLAGVILALAPQPEPAPQAVAVVLNDPEPLDLRMASWYGPRHAGRPTASGEIFNPEAFTYASRTDEFGTLLRLELCGRVAFARCNDRGPFVGGRDLNLSQAVARELGMIDAGVAIVSVRVVA